MNSTVHPLNSVVLAGGGTAGHVLPLLATADALRRRDERTRITVLGSEGGLEERLVPERGYDLRLIPKVAFPRRPNTAAVRFPSALAGAVRTTGQILDDVGAEVVVGFGGYVCPPAYLSARRRAIPLVVHEGNARAGLASRLGARITPDVATAFSTTRLPHGEVVGMPLRREVVDLDREALRDAALREFGLEAGFPTVLVTGGSLGAQHLNDVMRACIDDFRTAGIQVLHVTGHDKEFDPGEAPEGGPAYVVRPYAEQMQRCYAVADLVVTRSGAGMVCETSTLGLPAVFVPLPIGNGEQRRNAADVVRAGGALLVEDDDFDASWVRGTVIPLAGDAERLRAMASAAAGAGHRDADERLVDMIHRARARSTP